MPFLAQERGEIQFVSEFPLPMSSMQALWSVWQRINPPAADESFRKIFNSF
jgi:hypothetical protein